MTETAPRWKRRPPDSNWGDFGPDDELGRVNLLTAERVRRAAREIVTGKTFCLSLPLDRPATSTNVSRLPPRLFAVVRNAKPMYLYELEQVDARFTDVACDDAAILHTQFSTQWDAFAHVGQKFDADDDGVLEPRFYNGYRGGTDVTGPKPGTPQQPGFGFEGPYAHKLSIANFARHGMQGRGVLVDLHRRFGTQPVAVGYEALKRILDEDGIAPEEGDILCLYTGFADVLLAMAGATDTTALANSCCGLDGRDPELRRWIARSGIAAIAADNYGVEHFTNPQDAARKSTVAGRHPMLPLHDLCLFRLGIPLGELWYFGELAAWLHRHGRHRFFLTAPPLRLPGAAGSPVTPIATV